MKNEQLPSALPYTEAELSAMNRFVPYNPQQALEYASALRSEGFAPEAVSNILTQARLRTAAVQKFGSNAHRMLFTEAGYEQSTRSAVAKFHTQRFVEAGISSVADLGCGIGADSLGFAQAELSVVGIEIDPTVAALARFNLADFAHARVLCTDLKNLDVAYLNDDAGKPVGALWLDPARRTVDAGRTSSRTFDPEMFSPPLSFVKELATTGIPMGVKMGPGIPHEEIPDNCEAQWISHGGQVVEVVLWFNKLARAGVRRSAVVLDANPLEPAVLAECCSPVSEAEATPAVVGELGKYLYEPDGAIVRAHLVGELAQELNAQLLDEHIAYLTANHLSQSPAAQGFEVLSTMPINEKVLKRWVREENIGTLTIKKRGVDIVPESLRKKLLGQSKKKKGSESASLILTRLGEGAASQRIAIHTRPIS
ncbi:MAG: class I SAM-dependent methyltransferase [Rothia sp. (in: high G+C Gram-positive bacteria)]|nr:class I SAM-dependent methyltransferase [Rothia sp. (in: high G+C Gram-positive bacteria)]